MSERSVCRLLFLVKFFFLQIRFLSRMPITPAITARAMQSHGLTDDRAAEKPEARGCRARQLVAAEAKEGLGCWFVHRT